MAQETRADERVETSTIISDPGGRPWNVDGSSKYSYTRLCSLPLLCPLLPPPLVDVLRERETELVMVDEKRRPICIDLAVERSEPVVDDQPHSKDRLLLLERPVSSNLYWRPMNSAAASASLLLANLKKPPMEAPDDPIMSSA